MSAHPSSETEIMYFEGQFVPASEAKISIRTNAFLYGTSIFEGIRGYYLPETNQISIFRLREHYERMLSNARIFYMSPVNLGLDVDRLIAITVDLVKKNKPNSDIYIRPTLYKSDENLTPTLSETKTEFCLWQKPMGAYLDISKGLSVCVSNWRRLSDNALPPRGKAGGAYISTALAITDARNNGFDDAIYLTEAGNVSEGSAMNLFLIRNGQLITPSDTQQILVGITRDTVMTLAQKELGLKTQERVIDRTELYLADEAFFCGTGAQVTPIVKIDERPVGTGQIGTVTEKIQSLYFETVKAKQAQYQHWCTLIDLK